MGYLTKKSAWACPIHQAVLDKSVDELVETGRFKKDDVVKDMNFGAVGDAIRWDYIIDFITDKYRIEVVPMAESFWKRHKRDERQTNPAKFMAAGHGKKTCGYATVEMDGGVFALKKLEHKQKMSNGTGVAFREFSEKLRQRNIALPSDQPTDLPKLTEVKN